MSLSGVLPLAWSVPAPPRLVDPSDGAQLGARYLRGSTWASAARVLLPESGAPTQTLVVAIDFYGATKAGLDGPHTITHAWEPTDIGNTWYLAWSNAVDDDQRYVQLGPDLFAVVMIVEAQRFFGGPEFCIMVWPFRLTSTGEVTMGTARFVFTPNDGPYASSGGYDTVVSASAGNGRLSLFPGAANNQPPHRYLVLDLNPTTLTTSVVADNQDPFNGSWLLEVDTGGGVVALGNGHVVAGDSPGTGDGWFAVFDDTTGQLIAHDNPSVTTLLLGRTLDDRVIHSDGTTVSVTDEVNSTVTASAALPGAVRALGIALDASRPRSLLITPSGNIVAASRSALDTVASVPLPSGSYTTWLATDENLVYVLTAATLTAYGVTTVPLINNLRTGGRGWQPVDFTVRSLRRP